MVRMLCALIALATIFHRSTAQGLLEIDHHGEHALDLFVARTHFTSFLETSVTLTVNSTTLQSNGQWFSVEWKGVSSPKADDLVALYVPAGADVKKTSFVKYQWANSSSTAATGSGSLKFYLLNYRQPMQFAFLRNGTASPVVAAYSQVITPANVNEPTQGHLALTKDPTEMQVTWTTRDATNPEVKYGTSPGVYTSFAAATSDTYNRSDMCGGNVKTTGWVEPGLFHTAVMTGLKPATKYYYSYGDVYGFSAEHSFISSPGVGPNINVKVIVAADVGQQELDGSNLLTASEKGSAGVLRSIADDVNTNGYTLVTHNGDICYADGYLGDWETFQWLIAPAASAAPYMTTDGNHERDWPGTSDFFGISTDSRGECGVVYNTRFPMPTPDGITSDVVPTWYSFEYGPIHFLGFSTEVDFTPDSPQHDFIMADLAGVDRTKTPWLIVYGHRPIYVDSTDNATTDSMPSTSDQVVGAEQRMALEDLFYQYQVDLHFAGHIHLHQRSCPVFRGECMGFGSNGGANAPIYVITGNGGRALTTKLLDNKPAFTEVVYVDWGYTRLQANGTTLTLESVLTSSSGVNTGAAKVVNTFTLTNYPRSLRTVPAATS